MQYFCEAVGTLSDGGGTDDVHWYDLDIMQTFSVSSSVNQAILSSEEHGWRDVDVRYAMHRVEDHSGYSGRDRWEVRFM